MAHAEARYVNSAAAIFDQFDRADVSEAVRGSVRVALSVLLEDDGETVAPNQASFAGFLAFLIRHRDTAAPAVGVNRAGCFVAVWQEPTFRLSLEFRPNGHVFWSKTDRHDGGAGIVRNGSASVAEAPWPPKRQEIAYAS